ncbi:TylF/MycF family methyltransferase [Frankia sp. CNm7]|uniref:TylF/MycF family methyltransferase n=1 Tax=Frankia nepalensis TaxID=1836974 RepID=A0A937RLW0_9ACTN|nr:TylF/MycF family methyltransferase [Frankia nepalensis]MBL7495919.1 TylF/MycF family methyltransferase [Frankia nepalensis]MBL7513851.1 TylF/MycF family methyltransferase [Frankia nepalensis]MBL7524829.1 TylF/MycF family methyltransferase [Frankia nepalensis]MBL7632645.1 TylF/MycF family methyltransferase [Frankia nepalensis]
MAVAARWDDDVTLVSPLTAHGAGNEDYLDLMKRILTNTIYQDPPVSGTGAAFDGDQRATGQDWPTVAHTMVGLARLDNVQECAATAIMEGVPGDLVETGVWRGGTSIFMRAVLRAYGVTDRLVWVCDSFEGMPVSGPDSHPSDQETRLHLANAVLAVPLEQVRANFGVYGLLDDQVRFLKGWFRDTLPTAPIERIAVLRLDGDLYESTMDALDNLYPKVSPGGFVIIDDYQIPACRAAVHDYRAAHGVTAPLTRIDQWAVFWRLPGPTLEERRDEERR